MKIYVVLSNLKFEKKNDLSLRNYNKLNLIKI